MASLMDSYEQQYSNVTAEIVSKIGKIPNIHGEEKRSLVTSVEKLVEDSHELLEQMDLEIRTLSQRERQKYSTRLGSYKAELSKLEKDFKKSKAALTDHARSRNELMGTEDGKFAEDQRAMLLDNAEKLERTGKKLDAGYRTCLETEEIGRQVLEDLHSQRETIDRSRDRLRDTNENLGKSSRVVTGMMKRIIQNRVLLVAMAILMVIVIGIAVYFAARKSS